MTSARDIMNADPRCVLETETVHEAAERMAKMSVGALPICGADNEVRGMLTDRDVVVKVVAAGKDTRTVRAGELAQGGAVTVGAADSADEIIRAMTRHQVRRLPVTEGGRLVGVVAQADVARALDNPQVGDLLEAMSVD